MINRPSFTKTFNHPISALILTVGMAFGASSQALATSSIASSNGTSDCAACHGSSISKSTGQAGISAFCKSKYPAGTGAYNSSFVCTAVATPTPTPKPTSVPTPVPTSVPTPTPVPTTVPTPTPVPTACNSTHDDEHDTNVAPTLTAPKTVSVVAGQKLTFAVTAFDCAGREITIKATKGLPRGAKIVNSFDSQLQMYKAVITWTPATDMREQTINVTLAATVKTDSGRTLYSAPKTVAIQVLRANNRHHDDD